jgi:hypothetical protein
MVLTKEYLLRWLRDHRLRLEEVEHSGRTKTELREDGQLELPWKDVFGRDGKFEESRAVTPFGTYVVRRLFADSTGWTVGVEGEEAFNFTMSYRDEAMREAQRDYEQRLPLSAKFPAYVLPGGQNYRELLLTWPEDSVDFPHDHWDDASNVLAHVRFNERIRIAVAKVQLTLEVIAYLAMPGQSAFVDNFRQFIERLSRFLLDVLQMGLKGFIE